MLGTNQYATANDNDPEWRNPSLDIIDYKTFVRGQNVANTPSFGVAKPDLPALPVISPVKAKTAENSAPKPKKNIALIPWIAATLFCVWAFVNFGDLSVKMISALAVIITGLWTAQTARKQKKFQLAELANLGAIFGGVGALITGNALLGSPVSPSDGLGIIAVGSLVLASVIRSPICLIVSICAAMLWAVLGFMGIVPHSLAFVAFPVIASIQLYYASALRSQLAALAATLTCYVWLIGYCLIFVNSGAISLLMASGIVFIAGLTQYRWGKAFEDEQSYNSPVHTHFGWMTAILSALAIQHYWLFPESTIWQNIPSTLLGSAGWQLITALGLAAIYMSGLVRWKHKRVTKTGAFAATLIAALIPMTIWAAPVMDMIVTSVPGLYASPIIGLIIAGGILASGVGMALNGIRRNSTKMIMLAMLAIGAQAAFLLTPSLITFENAIVFGLSLVFALAAGGLIAGKSLLNRADGPGKLLGAS